METKELISSVFEQQSTLKNQISDLKEKAITLRQQLLLNHVEQKVLSYILSGKKYETIFSLGDVYTDLCSINITIKINQDDLLYLESLELPCLKVIHSAYDKKLPAVIKFEMKD